MYTIYYDDIAISASENPHFAMSAATLTQKINSADSFSFTLPSVHPFRDLPQPRQGIVRIKNNGKTIFVGDVVEIKTEFDNSRTFECQGCLAWLNDICNIRVTAQSTVSQSFAARMSRYNSLCSEKRKIQAGQCTNKPTSSVRIFDGDSFTTIFDYFARLISSKGGIMLPRYETDGIYLDYIEAKDNESKQQIVFGKNLLNLDNFISASSTATAIYPTGKDGITISDVTTGGVSYVTNQALYNKLGMIAVPMQFEAETPSELLAQAKNTLNLLAVLNKSIELTAFDLSLVNADVDTIEIGDNVQVVSAPHGLNAKMVCTAKTMDFINPEQSSVTLGKAQQSMSEIVSMNQSAGSVDVAGNRQPFTLTGNGITGLSYTAYYYPLLNICFVRAYFKLSAELAAATPMQVLTIPENYRPGYAHAMSGYCAAGALSARVSSGNGVQIRCPAKIATTQDIYVTGFWFV